MTASKPATRSRAQAKPRSRRSSGPRNVNAPRRYGSETPRIYTKPLRRLTRNTSLGFEVIEFAAWLRARLLLVADLTEPGDPNLAAAYRALIPELHPWQKWFLIHALELLPGPDKIFRFRVILLLVARQNGKTTLMVVLILWRLFQDGAPKIIGASTKLDQAEETWDHVVMVAELIPELADEIQHVGKVNGSKFMQLDSLEEYFPQATNSNAGRGWSAEFVLVDELRAHKTWDTWSAISKTTTAKERGQVLGASNAGDAQAIVLRQLRAAAIAAIEGKIAETLDEEDLELLELLEASAIGLFEWSAREGRGIRDRDGWYEANPSLGYSITEAAIAVSLSDPEWVFRTEVLCQFVDTSQGGPFAEGSWEATRVATVDRDPERNAGYCIDVSHDRKMAYVAIGFYDTEGRLRGEIAAQRAGTDWIIPWLQAEERIVKPELVTLQTNGAPVSSLISDFETAGIELVPWAGPDLARASGMVYDEIEQGSTTHGDQPTLDVAAGTAVPKPSGDGWLIDRKNSPEDAAPLVAFAGVVWLMRVHGNKKRTSVYESRGLLTI
jgi:hypothetical protein